MEPCHDIENVLMNMVTKQIIAMEHQKNLSLVFNGMSHVMLAGKSAFIKFLSRVFELMLALPPLSLAEALEVEVMEECYQGSINLRTFISGMSGVNGTSVLSRVAMGRLQE